MKVETSYCSAIQGNRKLLLLLIVSYTIQLKLRYGSAKIACKSIYIDPVHKVAIWFSKRRMIRH